MLQNTSVEFILSEVVLKLLSLGAVHCGVCSSKYLMAFDLISRD